MNQLNSNLPVFMKIRKHVIEQIDELTDAGGQLPTVKEFCEQYKTSRPTVVKAMKSLSDEGYIIARRGLGMFVNPTRQRKRYGLEVGTPEGTIGMVYSSGTTNTFTTRMLKMLGGMSEVIADAGYHLRPINLSPCEKDIPKYLKEMNIDGLIWMYPSSLAMPLIVSLDKLNFPLVSISWNEKYRGKHFAGTNFSEFGYLHVNYFLELGHQNILYPCLPNEYCNDLEVQGMRKAYEDHGISPEHLRIVPCQEDPTSKIEALLDAGVSFTAVVSPTEYYHYLMDLFAKRNIDVPTDISISTDEELSTQNLTNPTPTLVSAPFVKMASEAAKGLISIIEDRHPKTFQRILKNELIEGETTIPLTKTTTNNHVA